MHRLALLGLLVGCANATPTATVQRWSEICSPASLDRSTHHQEVSMSLLSRQPAEALRQAEARLEVPGLQIQYESASETYANATWQIPVGSNVDLGAIQASLGDITVQSANRSDSDYGVQVRQQCDRLRLLEEAAALMDDAVTRVHGRAAEALLTERELNMRERQTQESSIQSLLDQSAFDRISISISLLQ